MDAPPSSTVPHPVGMEDGQNGHEWVQAADGSWRLCLPGVVVPAGYVHPSGMPPAGNSAWDSSSRGAAASSQQQAGSSNLAPGNPTSSGQQAFGASAAHGSQYVDVTMGTGGGALLSGGGPQLADPRRSQRRSSNPVRGGHDHYMDGPQPEATSMALDGPNLGAGAIDINCLYSKLERLAHGGDGAEARVRGLPWNPAGDSTSNL